MKATFVKDVSAKFRGEARLYRLDQAIEYGWDWDSEQYKGSTNFVVASAANVWYGGPETYVFASDEEGNVLDWSEKAGSFQGGLDHDRAIQGFEESYREEG